MLGENPAQEQRVPLLPWAESLPAYCKRKSFNRFELLMGALFFFLTGDDNHKAICLPVFNG